jgi:hypothetical protein
MSVTAPDVRGRLLLASDRWLYVRQGIPNHSLSTNIISQPNIQSRQWHIQSVSSSGHLYRVMQNNDMRQLLMFISPYSSY